MMRGIFRWDSSFIAICSASVSPSSGTSTGAFMLWEVRRFFIWFLGANLPDLQSSCTENAGPLVLCQVPGGNADLVRLAFALLLCGCCSASTVCHFLFTTDIITGFVLLIGFTFLIQTSLFTIRIVLRQEVVFVILFSANNQLDKRVKIKSYARRYLLQS